jgi:hypothetical protein
VHGLRTSVLTAGSVFRAPVQQLQFYAGQVSERNMTITKLSDNMTANSVVFHLVPFLKINKSSRRSAGSYPGMQWMAFHDPFCREP